MSTITDTRKPLPIPQGLVVNGKISKAGQAFLASLTGQVGDILAGMATDLTEATVAQYWGNVAGLLGLTPERVWAAQAFQTLTDAATIAIDFSLGFNFQVTIGADRILGNPSNYKLQSGCIAVTASGADRVLSFDTNWRKLSASIATPITILSGTRCDIYYAYAVTNRPVITGYGNTIVNA